MKDPLRGLILDIDGVLEFQGQVYPGAVETVQQLRDRNVVLRFLTNSTLKSRASCTEKLCRAGFRVAPEQVITASYATARYLEALKPRSCWILLEREGLDEFQHLPQDAQDPEYVVVGDYRDGFNFANLNKALRLLCKGAKLVAMIPELVDSSLGEAELNVGSWASMLERAAGVTATYIGKPGRYVFELALETMGLDPGSIAIVGDQVSTDIRGGQTCGLRTILLRTGEFRKSDLERGISPDYVLDDIRELLEVL